MGCGVQEEERPTNEKHIMTGIYFVRFDSEMSTALGKQAKVINGDGRITIPTVRLVGSQVDSERIGNLR